MSKGTFQARANPYLMKKVRWIVANDNYSMAQIIREGVRMFILNYEKSKRREASGDPPSESHTPHSDC